MAWFALGVIGVVLLWLGARAFVNADPKVLAKGIKIAAALTCGALAVFFLIRGRIDAALMLGIAAGASLGYLPRGFSAFTGLFGKGGRFGGRGLGSGWSRARTGYDAGPADAASGSGQQSRVETAWLRMRLDHATGRMDGEVLQGSHAGSRLSSLSFESVIALLRECQVADNQSAALLEAYLDRMAGEDWRERASARPGSQSRAGETKPGSTMARDQAYEILRLKPGATAEAIKAAHRRLMKKFHPDQGGSTHLAAQINQAKDLLLGE